MFAFPVSRTAASTRFAAFVFILTALGAAESLAQDRAPAVGSVFRDCPECPEMVVIPAGGFVMGSALAESGHQDEKPQHPVKFTQPLAVSKFELAFEQWDACTAAGRCPQASDDGFGRGSYPVINVSWDDAKGYLAWLSERTGKRYRLLTESEWEYAARGGTTTPWFWGTAEDSWGSRMACEFANTHDETSKETHPMYVWSNHRCADGYAENAPVGRFEPNAFGLYDMIGNVREWVEDCHAEGYAGMPADGSVRPLPRCERHLVRGGGWMDGPSTCRSAYRYAEDGAMRNYQIGFRVARALP